MEKEKGKKGDWDTGWGQNEELELIRSGTIVESRRRMRGNFLREIWGNEEETREGKGGGKSSGSNSNTSGWISGGFLRSTTRGVESAGKGGYT